MPSLKKPCETGIEPFWGATYAVWDTDTSFDHHGGVAIVEGLTVGLVLRGPLGNFRGIEKPASGTVKVDGVVGLVQPFRELDTGGADMTGASVAVHTFAAVVAAGAPLVNGHVRKSSGGAKRLKFYRIGLLRGLLRRGGDGQRQLGVG